MLDSCKVFIVGSVVPKDLEKDVLKVHPTANYAAAKEYILEQASLKRDAHFDDEGKQDKPSLMEVDALLVKVRALKDARGDGDETGGTEPHFRDSREGGSQRHEEEAWTYFTSNTLDQIERELMAFEGQQRTKRRERWKGRKGVSRKLQLLWNVRAPLEGELVEGPGHESERRRALDVFEPLDAQMGSTPPGLELKNSSETLHEEDSDVEIPLMSVEDFPVTFEQKVLEKKIVPKGAKFKKETQKQQKVARKQRATSVLEVKPKMNGVSTYPCGRARRPARTARR